LGYISDRVTEMLGFEPREFVDHPEFWESRVHPDDLLSTKAATSNLKEGQYACDYRFLHKRERYRWIREEARLIRDVNGKPLEVIGCWTDITELKDFEQRLAQAEHLAAIGETAAMVGHDLRNPLQGIAAATYLLRNESLTTDERSELLRLIENNVEYSDGIVKDLLDYSRPLDLTLTEITPREIITSTLQTTRVPDRIKIQNLSQEDPSVSVDPDRMKRAFVNLIENAVDAMPNGGTITISTRESNGFLEIAFADTGLGLPEEILDNLWKPLRTTKAKGMGLGLAIVKRIVDAHGGEVSVKSKTGKGTTYTIRLRLKRNKL
jgi:PAS domain S-box-containing protein